MATLTLTKTPTTTEPTTPVVHLPVVFIYLDGVRLNTTEVVR